MQTSDSEKRQSSYFAFSKTALSPDILNKSAIALRPIRSFLTKQKFPGILHENCFEKPLNSESHEIQ